MEPLLAIALFAKKALIRFVGVSTMALPNSTRLNPAKVFACHSNPSKKLLSVTATNGNKTIT